MNIHHAYTALLRVFIAVLAMCTPVAHSSGEVRPLDKNTASAEAEPKNALSGVFSLDPKANSNIADTLIRGLRNKGLELGLSRDDVQELTQFFESFRSVREEKALTFTQDGRFVVQSFIPFSKQPKLSGTWAIAGDGLFSLNVEKIDAEHLRTDIRKVLLQTMLSTDIMIQRVENHLLLLEIPGKNHPSPGETLYAVAIGLQLNPEDVATRFNPGVQPGQFSRVTTDEAKGSFVADLAAKEKSRIEVASRLSKIYEDIETVTSLGVIVDEWSRGLGAKKELTVGEAVERVRASFASPVATSAKVRLELQAEPQVFKLSIAEPFRPERNASGIWSIKEGGFIRFEFDKDDNSELSQELAAGSRLMGGYCIDGSIYIVNLPSSSQDFYSLDLLLLSQLLELDVLHFATKFKRE